MTLLVEPMTIKKYINTGELAGLTGCQDEEIRELAKNGVLPAHKTRRGMGVSMWMLRKNISALR